MCTFFIANAYYQIKTNERTTKPDSQEFIELQRKEESNYERAKTLRKELLREAHNKAETLMSKINEKVDANSLVNIPDIPPFKHRGGIESRTIFERLEHMIVIMQAQKTQINEWRDKTIGLLLLTLVDEEEADLEGDEYETSTKRQDEVYVYVDVLRALIADRHDVITGQSNELIKHEVSVALKQAKEGNGHSPELLLTLLSRRNRIKPAEDVGSLRGMITEFRELKVTLRAASERGNPRAAAELLIVNVTLENLHQISTEQTKAVAGLDHEIDLFKDTMNMRLDVRHFLKFPPSSSLLAQNKFLHTSMLTRKCASITANYNRFRTLFLLTRKTSMKKPAMGSCLRKKHSNLVQKLALPR